VYRREELQTGIHILWYLVDVQALGVAIEARRSDVIVRILEASQDSNLLGYLLTMSMEFIRNIKWRNEVRYGNDLR
jgi:hypothetical protein